MAKDVNYLHGRRLTIEVVQRPSARRSTELPGLVASKHAANGSTLTFASVKRPYFLIQLLIVFRERQPPIKQCRAPSLERVPRKPGRVPTTSRPVPKPLAHASTYPRGGQHTSAPGYSKTSHSIVLVMTWLATLMTPDGASHFCTSRSSTHGSPT